MVAINNKEKFDLSAIDANTREDVAEGVASTVYRARAVLQNEDADAEGLLVAIKTASANQRLSPEPHDIVKEIAILSKLSHGNIIPVLQSRLDKSSNRWELITPWILYSLDDLLNIPSFTPHDCPASIRHLILPLSAPTSTTTDSKNPSASSIFSLISKSIIYQTSLAISYLHDRPEPIAHRDIKPRNVLITETGRVQLIDFGIAYEQHICSQRGNMWPETVGKMYSDVATGPYRAPELLFGPSTYDACATDLWSLGTFICQFYTPIVVSRRSLYGNLSDEPDEDEDTESTEHVNGYIIPSNINPKAMLAYNTTWMRQTLFDATKGTIGLAWSIFKVFGSPSKDNWPEFDDLPDARKIQFIHTDGIALSTRLPNLPKSEVSFKSQSQIKDVTSDQDGKVADAGTSQPLDLVVQLLRYSPAQRLKIVNTLKHPWFTGTSTPDKEHAPLLLPIDHRCASDISWETKWHGEDLGHWLRVMFGEPEQSTD